MDEQVFALQLVSSDAQLVFDILDGWIQNAEDFPGEANEVERIRLILDAMSMKLFGHPYS